MRRQAIPIVDVWWSEYFGGPNCIRTSASRWNCQVFGVRHLSVGKANSRSFSFSSSKGWRVDKAYLFTTPGGEPLWRVSRRPSQHFVISLMPPKHVKTGGSRECPSVLRAQPRACNRIEKLRVNTSRWVIPGSRPLQDFFVGWSARTKYREVV